jgi:hypothetical protein
MSRGLGSLQRQILTTLEQAGQPLWLADLLRQLWGPQPTRSQEESTRRALTALEQRGLAFRARAEWENYADQQAGHRVKVWLPNQPPPRLQAQLTAAQVEQAIREVLRGGDHQARVLLRPAEQARARQFGPQWMPYSRFLEHLHRRIGRVLGETPARWGRAERAVQRAVQRLEQQGVLQIARCQRQRIFIRLRPEALGCPT